MCVIIDANVRDLFFNDPCDAELRPLWDWISSGDGHTVYGGKHTQEVFYTKTAARVLANWVRAGRASLVVDEEIDEEVSDLVASGLVQSNDHHIIALARITRSHLVSTNDQLLETDIKNKNLVDKPRGKIYKKSDHKGLLTSKMHCSLK